MADIDPSFQGDIPEDLLDEFFHYAAARAKPVDLKKFSLVSRRWRWHSQKLLFSVVKVDPFHHHRLYYVHMPANDHLIPHIKEVQVIYGPTSTIMAPHNPVTHYHLFRFSLVLRRLHMLQSLVLAHSRWDWSTIPRYAFTAFLAVLWRPSFRSLQLLDGQNFPTSLFRFGFHVETLVVRNIRSLAPLHPGKIPAVLLTPLMSLCLTNCHTIRAVIGFFMANVELVAPYLRNLSRLEFGYCECVQLPSLPAAHVVGDFLHTFGASIKSLQLQIICPPSIGGLRFLPSRLGLLHNLRELNLVLIIGLDIVNNALGCTHQYVLPFTEARFITSQLEVFLLEFHTYYLEEDYMGHAGLCCTALEKVIPLIFGNGHPWVRLKELRMSVQLFVDDDTRLTMDLPCASEDAVPEATIRRAFVRIRPCNIGVAEGENQEQI